MAADPSLCAEEQVPHRADSPGVVGADESLGRIVFTSELVAAGGGLKPTAFLLTDIGKTTRDGLSLNRMALADEGALRRQAHEIADRRGLVLAGNWVASCGAVRSLTDHDGARAFCVLDVPTRKNRAHAIARTSKPRSESELKAVREYLIEVFRPDRTLLES